MSTTRLLLVLAALTTTTACSGDGGGGKKDNGPLNDLDAAYSSAISVDLTWVNEAEGATNVLVQRALDNSGPFEDLATIAADATEYRDQSGLDLTTQYYYKVVVVGGLDEGGSSRVVTPGDPPSLPGNPAVADSITTTVVGPSEIDVEWEHSGENVIGFRLERKMNFTGGFSFVQIADLPADARSFSDTCLSPEAPFLYRITAYNESGATAVLETPANTITPSAVLAPTAPFNLQAIPLNADSYRIQWENGCSQAQGILPEVNVNGGGYQLVLPVNQYFAPDAKHFFYVDLPQGSSYEFRLTAFNDMFAATSSATATATGPVTPPPPSGGWIGIYADYDNTVVFTDLGPTSNATAYPNGNLISGCFWNFNTFLAMQNFICYSSAIHFPLSGLTTGGQAFDLTGKTIDQAVLVLSVSSVSLSPTNLNLYAIATPWATSSLNGNTQLNVYNAGASINGSPLGYGNYGIDVTTITQNWANGSAANHGVYLEDAEFVFPYGNYIRSSFFWSTDNYNGSFDNKPTLWVNYQ